MVSIDYCSSSTWHYYKDKHDYRCPSGALWSLKALFISHTGRPCLLQLLNKQILKIYLHNIAKCHFLSCIVDLLIFSTGAWCTQVLFSAPEGKRTAHA